MASIQSNQTVSQPLTGTNASAVLQKMQWLGKHNYYAPTRVRKGLWQARRKAA